MKGKSKTRDHLHQVCLFNGTCAIETCFAVYNDALGSPVAITNAVGEALNRYVYEPFGNIINSKRTVDSLQRTEYTFTGKERDAESDLFYYGARYYNPILGRFISKDVLGPDYEDPQSVNKYVYTLNNPIRYIDPNGAMSVSVNGWITSFYGLRDLSLKTGKYHTGTDVANAPRTPIGSMLPGSMIYANYNTGYGYNEITEHEYEGRKIWIKQNHLTKDSMALAKNIMAQNNGQVSEQQQIAWMGNTGWVTGYHEDLEIFTKCPIKNGKYDPDVMSKENRPKYTIDAVKFLARHKALYNSPQYNGTQYQINYSITINEGGMYWQNTITF